PDRARQCSRHGFGPDLAGRGARLRRRPSGKMQGVIRPLARTSGALATLLATVTVLLLAAAGAASAKIVADSGFRPAVNGFSFENYTRGHADLSANELRRLFGRSVCAFTTRSGGCVLAPPAQLWMEEQNRGML